MPGWHVCAPCCADVELHRLLACPAGNCLAYHAADDGRVAQFRVAALINDSVGTLAGGCYVDADTKIGVILGTGTNACYVEHSSAIAALANNNGHGQRRPHMAINTEWGNYDASSTPYTDVRRTSYTLAWVQHHAGLKRSIDDLLKEAAAPL